MGAREDFNKALRQGNFFAAARAWATANLDKDEGVEAFESKLQSSLEDHDHVVGETLTMHDGEWTYLGNNGMDGNRIAYLPNTGSLNRVTYFNHHDEVFSFMQGRLASQSDTETVIAFFTLSERQAKAQFQQQESGEPQHVVAPEVALPAAPGNAQRLSPEAALRQMVAPQGDPRELVDALVKIASQDFKNDRVHVGTLVEFGPAPYKFDDKNEVSFFITMVGPDQQKETIWGKELATVVKKQDLTVGSDIVLSHQGEQPLTIKVRERDESGAPTGRLVDTPVWRNHWKAMPLDQLHGMAVEEVWKQAIAQEQTAEAQPVDLPAPVADFKKRLQNTAWFYDGIEDEAERTNGQQSLAQLREDFKALMVEFPEEAAEVWRAEAPAEFQADVSDLMGQLESAAPDVIKAHHDHERGVIAHQDGVAGPQTQNAIQPVSAVESQEQSAIQPATAVETQEQSTIQPATAAETQEQNAIQAATAAETQEQNAIQPATIAEIREGAAEGPEKGEDSIRPAVIGQTGARLAKQGDDAISRIAGSAVDSISNAGAAKRAVEPNTAGHEDAAGKSAPKTLLNGRFVLRDQGQYFRVADGVESTRVALVDEVDKIRFVDKQMDAFQAAIELAKHKQWEAILVTGSEKFRAEAWHHARIAGLEVVGYEPSEKDLATLKAAQEGKAKVDQGKGVAAPEAKPDDADKAKSLKAAQDYAIDKGYGVTELKARPVPYMGKIIHDTDKHIVQDLGRKVVAVHDKDSFDKQALRSAMDKGKSIKIQYQNGRAVIEGSKERSQERGR